MQLVRYPGTTPVATQRSTVIAKSRRIPATCITSHQVRPASESTAKTTISANTGFDSKSLNVDKNLRFHGLVQAYSRTNRILVEVKSQGNIVVFRNLKKRTDGAIALFSNVKAKENNFPD